jgi:two-component system, chemotaxis family, sensor kinase Cph1
VVLMDVMLAGELRGTQTAKVVQERFAIPVVYLTGYNDRTTLKEIAESGDYGFLTKPIRAEDLQPVIELAISRHEKELRHRDAERRVWEDICRRSQEQLEQFTYAAGHDLKEPLRTATSFMELLARRSCSKLDGEERELLGEAQNALIRMTKLLDDLLGYAQAGLSEGAPIPRTPADAALKCALDNLRGAIADSGATITNDALPMVHADPSQLALVFQNLLANAIKYRRPEDASCIHVAVEDRENEWVFTITDNGIGFDQQHADRIFLPFRRLHSRAEYPGTGVGLAICRKVIDAHGGRMWAESTPGHGAVFSFTLPRRE